MANPKETKETKEKIDGKEKIVKSVYNSDHIHPQELNTLIIAEQLQRGSVNNLPSSVHRGLCAHHIKSMDEFYGQGLPMIIREGFHVRRAVKKLHRPDAISQQIEEVVFEVKWTDVELRKPTKTDHKYTATTAMYPVDARRYGLTYSAPLVVSATIKAEAIFKASSGRPKQVREQTSIKRQIRNMLIMVGTSPCPTSTMTGQQRLQYGEDNTDFGAHFIIRGLDWGISCIDTNPYNTPRIYKNFGHRNEMARLELISKPGDHYQNSVQIIIAVWTDSSIMVQLGVSDFGGKKGIWIPMHIFYRLLGCENDLDIIESIAYSEAPANLAKSDNQTINPLIKNYLVQAAAAAMHAPGGDFAEAVSLRGPDLRTKFVGILDGYNAKTRKPTRDENDYKNYLNANLDRILNRDFLPHVGTEEDSRPLKHRNLGRLIRQLLLTELGVLEQTDRDKLGAKRAHAAGHAFAKSFKKVFNKTQQTIRNRLERAFNTTAFDQVQLATVYESAISDKTSQDLEKKLCLEVQKSKNDDKRKGHQSHMATEQLARKNNLNYDAALRVIRTSQKPMGSTRNEEIRQVHSSYALLIDPIQSADTGDQVGRVREMAITASITSATSSSAIEIVLKNEAAMDPNLFIPISKLHNWIPGYVNCSCVHINGRWVGASLEGPRLVRRLLEYRRGYRVVGLAKTNTKMQYKMDQFEKSSKSVADIDYSASISWSTDTNEIHIWCDNSRMIAPLLIVRNNSALDPIGVDYWKSKGIAPYDPVKNPSEGDGCFVQDTVLTHEHISGLLKARYDKPDSMTMKKLVQMGIIDYVSPDEMEGLLVAQDLETLKANRHNPIRQYTHLQVPAALLGLPALTAAYPDHDQAPRLIFQTNQGKQTCGISGRNYPFRMDKHASMQLQNEMPIVYTVANSMTRSNGLNAIVVIDSVDGYNQEDSLEGNSTSSNRGMFRVYHTNTEKKDLTNREQLRVPPEGDRHGKYRRRADINYNSLDPATGIVRLGHVLKQGDALIGAIQPLDSFGSGADSGFEDRTKEYTHPEPAIVTRTVEAPGAEGNKTVRVQTMATREGDIGEKFCRLPTAEVLAMRNGVIGWIQLQNIRKNDRVASLVNDKLEYVDIIDIHKFDVNEKLYKIAHGHFQIVCTDKHKLYCNMSENENNELAVSPRFNPSIAATPDVTKSVEGDLPSARARLELMRTTPVQNKPMRAALLDRSSGPLDIDGGELIVCNKVVEALRSGKNMRFLNGGGVHRPSIHEFFLGNITGQCVRADRYLELVSLFLPYGQLLADTVTFSFGVLPKELSPSQKESIINVYNRLVKLCKDCNWTLIGKAPFEATETSWHIYNRHVAEEMAKYINWEDAKKDQLTRHEQKKLSADMFNLSSKQSKQFLGLLFSSNKYVTSSWQLANDLQVMSIHADMSARVRKSDNGNIWETWMSGETNSPKLGVRNISEVNHKGVVMCLEVASHVYMLRENSMSVPFWDGNSSRHGQKGMFGMRKTHSQMLFTESGLTPDFVLSPHAIPSRMTISQLIEDLVAKQGAVTGRFYDATAFTEVDMWEVGDALERIGFERHGREVMYNGVTGDRVDRQLFIGPTYYQRLQKFVRDELYWISTGPTNAITRQPLEGKSQIGGLRLGEMEHDVIMTHGSSWWMMEKFRDHSDGYDAYYCRCGKRAIVNETVDPPIRECPRCEAQGRDPEIYTFATGWASKTMLQENETCGVGQDVELEPFRYESV